ncbi:MAG: hypothetical protein J1F17_06900 [Oscillospiraceae bacterium]|nr:hypothetical protein [Oscillospiraceae bacterium]
MIIAIIIAIILIIELINKLKQRFIIRTFENGSVLVGGARGKGKDLLFNYVVNKRKKTYISNVNYGNRPTAETAKTKDFKHIELEPKKQWQVGGNTYDDFINGTLKHYESPYDKGIDYYVSDMGVYTPAQEQGKLCKMYPEMPIFQALLRQLQESNLHGNCQAFNRPWDKIREQFETYILCRSCKVIFGKIVFQKLYVYERYQSAVDKVKPMKKRWGKAAKIEYDKFVATYGEIKKVNFHYVMKGKYDTYRFRTMLKEVEL